MSGPILTVLMTVRNGEPYLHEAVASIVNQTYGNFRFLILDNASTDNSREVIRAFHDPRIDLVELSEDIGQTAALNRGLEMVDTPWVARMDADDISLPQRLELQMEYIRRHPEIILLGTGIYWMDANGRITGERECPLTEADIHWVHLTGGCSFGHSAAVLSTRAAKQVGGYPVQYRYAQDYAFWCRLLDLGRGTNIPQRLVNIRLHNASTTNYDVAGQETRAILQQHLCKLYPNETDVILRDVARALCCDFSLCPSSVVVHCLLALPERFVAVQGSHPSRALLRKYRYQWLFIARMATRQSRRRALVWIRLALQIQPGLLASARLWYTVATVAAGRFPLYRPISPDPKKETAIE